MLFSGLRVIFSMTLQIFLNRATEGRRGGAWTPGSLIVSFFKTVLRDFRFSKKKVVTYRPSLVGKNAKSPCQITELKMYFFCHFFVIFLHFFGFFLYLGIFFLIMSFFMILKIENNLEVYFKYILYLAHFV